MIITMYKKIQEKQIEIKQVTSILSIPDKNLVQMTR